MLMLPFTQSILCLGLAFTTGVLFMNKHPIFGVLSLIAATWFYVQLDRTVNK